MTRILDCCDICEQSPCECVEGVQQHKIGEMKPGPGPLVAEIQERIAADESERSGVAGLTMAELQDAVGYPEYDGIEEYAEAIVFNLKNIGSQLSRIACALENTANAKLRMEQDQQLYIRENQRRYAEELNRRRSLPWWKRIV